MLISVQTLVELLLGELLYCFKVFETDLETEIGVFRRTFWDFEEAEEQSLRSGNGYEIAIG